jgi:hypothetical protein
MSPLRCLVIACTVFCFCGLEHSIPRQAPAGKQRPADTSHAEELDSLSRAVAHMMRTYFHTIDSSMRTDPLQADSFDLPADGFLEIDFDDTTQSSPRGR